MNPHDRQLHEALDDDVWATVQGRLLTKMVEEFSYEEIVTPRKVDAGADRSRYRFDLGEASYRFEATERLLDSLSVDGDTVQRQTDDGWTPVSDPTRLLRDIGASTELDGLTEGNLLREFKKTLLADAHVEARRRDRDGFDPLELDTPPSKAR